jgi:hypothetical protein
MTSRRHFVWDSLKEKTNLQKHGIAFKLAPLAFADPCVHDELEGNDHGEVRWRATGRIGEQYIFVSYTWAEKGEDEVFRIISARKATPRERRAYERHAQTYR